MRTADTARRLTLWIRKRIPKRIRHVLRLGRHVIAKGKSSAWIPANLLSTCRVCPSRHDLVGLLPHGGRIAEVGTDKGHFSRHILAVCQPDKLHLVDLDFSRLETDVAEDPRIVMHNGTSSTVLAEFPDFYFDWIYIDADHSYDGVSLDAKVAASKIRPGGYLVFNDFAHMDPFLGAYGVHRAVVDFAVAHGWQFAWIAYEPSALYDIALRRTTISNREGAGSE